MSEYPKISLAFNIGKNNDERIEAFELYRKAFNARKTSESTPPDGEDIHICMEINGLEILLAPGSEDFENKENATVCQIHFDNEKDLRKTYEILIQEGHNFSIEGPLPWAILFALVTDKFGFTWALYFNNVSGM